MDEIVFERTPEGRPLSLWRPIERSLLVAREALKRERASRRALEGVIRGDGAHIQVVFDQTGSYLEERDDYLNGIAVNMVSLRNERGDELAGYRIGLIPDSVDERTIDGVFDRRNPSRLDFCLPPGEYTLRLDQPTCGGHPWHAKFLANSELQEDWLLFSANGTAMAGPMVITHSFRVDEEE
ncbi:MAG: hypothetical protein AAFY15_15815 [Cyanobacteria bacterium J06648_11]